MVECARIPRRGQIGGKSRGRYTMTTDDGAEGPDDARRAERSGSEASGGQPCEAHGARACHMCHNCPRGPATRFPKADEVEAVAASMAGATDLDPVREVVVSVSPGTVAVGRRQREKSPVPADREVPPRGKVLGWSRKSRARMARRLAELDYGPMFADPSRLPAMVTLTLPADFRTSTPCGAVFKQQVRTFQKRYERKWGPLVGVWKLEFQARGAPHLHMLVCPESGPAFRSWLSTTWADVVAHPDPAERAAHVRAGTNVDYGEGIRNRDPRRVAVYFSKHGQFKDKDAQNRVPEGWEDVGRFWGYWGLSPAVSEVEVTPDEAVKVARLLRRHARCRVVKRVKRVRVAVVDTETGEVLRTQKVRYRRSGTRLRRMTQGAGFVCVNDGPALARDVARYVALLRI